MVLQERAAARPVQSPMDTSVFRNRLLWALAAMVIASIALALAYKHTALGSWVTPENAIAWVEAIDGNWWAPLLVILSYSLAQVVMFPRPLITLAAVIAFGPYKGFAIAMTGILLASAVGYWIGMVVDEERIRRMAGPRLKRLREMLQRRGWLAVATVRVVPVAPFFVEGVVAGALRIGLHHLLIGTFLGMLPGTLTTTILGDEVAAALTGARDVNWAMVAAAGAVLAAIGLASHRWWKRMQASHA
jgi:phospholipase D1/2